VRAGMRVFAHAQTPACTACVHVPREYDARAMNVLMIVIDDLRPAIAALGDARAVTPSLDRFVRSGVGFTQAHCQHPICTASRASALTGCRPDTTRVHLLNTRLRDVRPDLPTIPRVFRQAGYETVTVGKVYHHAYDDPEGWTRHVPVPQMIQPTHALPENRALNDLRRADPEHVRMWGPPTECAELPDEAYSDFHIAARATEALTDVRGRPFFVAAGFAKPHLPLTCPKRYWDLYNRAALAAAVPHEPLVNPAPATIHEWGELRQYAGMPRDPDDVTPAQRAELIHGYYACVSYLDAQIGRLLDALDALGLRESTIVCLWADHGLILGEYGMWAKHTLLDAATRVPLAIRDPRRPSPGRTCDRVVELLDVFPTLAELADLPKPPTPEGCSLVPLLVDPAANRDERALSQYPRSRTVRGRSVRTPTLRFTRWWDESGAQPDQVELYDMTGRGFETVNVVDDPARRDDVARLSVMVGRIGDGR
jgi:iduronate 2-sulfatase